MLSLTPSTALPSAQHTSLPALTHAQAHSPAAHVPVAGPLLAGIRGHLLPTDSTCPWLAYPMPPTPPAAVPAKAQTQCGQPGCPATVAPASRQWPRQAGKRAAALPQDVLQRIAQLAVLVGETGRLCALGEHALPLQHHRRALAQQRLQRKVGHRQPGGAAHDAAQRGAQLAHAHGLGRGGVVHARVRRVAQRLDHQLHQVVAVDPRHPLAARAQRPAGKDLEHGQHLAQRAALGREHDADAQHHGARHALRALGGRLPLFTDLSQVVAASRRVLHERRGLGVAVEAHSRRRHQHLGPLALGGGPDGIHNCLRGSDTRCLDLSLVLWCPPGCNRLACQVHHPSGTLDRVSPF
mmetsp:Transcript_9752/g.24273  ORF Transcript_9752/g.24273 Transcript_9752/m.24273 type:complete len:352 (+) Transcript_9752:1691-2746(+)